MTANSWYCIAQTSVFDSGCSIHVAFDGYSIQFSVSVRYGTSSINVSDCNIPSTMKFSVRLREVNKSWFVDLYCNKDIIPTVTIADSLYWSESNAQANAGIILALITDISNKFNPTPGGGSGGLDVDQLQEYLTSNNYITNITLQEAIAPILDWFELKTLSDGSRVLVTKYNLATEKNLGWGGYDGVGSNPGSGASYNRLDSWSAYDETAGDVLSAKLGYGLKTSIENIEQTLGSGLLSKVTVKLGFTDYESVDGVVSLPAYPIIPTKLSAFTDDVGYAKQSDVQQIFQTYSENLEAVENRVKVNEDNILSLDGRIESVEDWFTLQTVAGVKTLVTKYPLATQKNLIWGGSSGDGTTSSVSYNRLDSWDGYTDAMAGYVLSAGLGYSLKQTIDNISSQQLTKVTVKVGSVAYNSVGGVVSLPAYPTIPAKLSSFTDDVGYAKQSDVEAISLRLDNFFVASDTDTIINKWHELEAFLAGQSESSTLAELLGIKADKSVVEALSNRVTVNEGNITSLQENLISVENRVTNIEDWFEIKTLSDGSKQLVTKYHLATQKGLTWGGNSGQGSSSSSTSYNRLDTWDGYTDSMAGYILSAGLGYELKQAIDNISSNTISKVTVKLGSVAYDSVNGVVSLPAYPTVPTVPTKLSELIDDLVAGNYLPLTGGTITGQLNVANINGYIPITSGNAVAYCGLYANNATIDLNNTVGGFRAGKLFNAANAATANCSYRGFLEYGGGYHVAQFNSDAYNNLYYRWCENTTWLPWRTVAFTDSNVASADYAASAGNTDLLDGSHLSDIWQRYYNVEVDLNDVRSATAWCFVDWDFANSGGVTNQPWASSAAGVWSFPGRYGLQIAKYYNTDLIMLRAYNGNTWNDWKQLAFTDSNVASATKLQAARTIWGKSFDGTQDISGALSASNINITSADTIAHLAFGRQGGNFITAPTDGYIAFIPGGQSIATANADLVITDGIVYPGTTGVTKLGFGDKRWSQVTSVDGDFSGALTAGTFSTANVVSCGGRLRINASNSVTSFGFIKATAYTSALNIAVLDIGSNYGGSSDIASEAVDVVAMSMYRGAVGVGRAYSYDELYANRASNVMLSVEGNAQATGSITAASFNGNATSATKLATARSIYGQAFDGTQDITSAKVINFTDAESYSANESGAARIGRFDTNGGLKIQLGNSDDAVIEIVNKGATIALLRMDASGNLRVKGNLIVEGNLTWGGAL